MLALVCASQLQIFVRGLLRLLDEAVQKHHPAPFVDVEEHSGDAVPRDIAAHLIETASQGPAHRHPYRPAELNCLDVLTDPLAVLR
jgi:hypothetical protein